MESFQTRGLRKAAKLLGGNQRLAFFLEVRPEELERWLARKAPVPQPIIVSVIELLAGYEELRSAQSQRLTLAL